MSNVTKWSVFQNPVTNCKCAASTTPTYIVKYVFNLNYMYVSLHTNFQLMKNLTMYNLQLLSVFSTIYVAIIPFLRTSILYSYSTYT